MDKFTLGLVLVIFISFVPNGSQAIKDIEIKELKCDHNKDVANNITCNVKMDHGKKHVLDLSATLLKEIKDVIVNIRISKKDGEQIVPLVNATEDFCSFMESKSKGFYVEIAMKMLRDVSNIDHPCPYSGYLYANNVNPDPNLIPAGIPAGEYIIETTLYENDLQHVLGHVKIVGVLID